MENNLILKDTINKFSSFSQYNYSASLGTTVYGTFNFGYGKKIQSTLHFPDCAKILVARVSEMP